MKILGYVVAALLLGACASFDGRGLVPGQSRAGDVEQAMGSPDQRLSLPNGDTALYYSRLPEGRAVYVATVGADGTLRGIEQRLDYPFIKKIVPDTTTAKQVRELLGPPWTATRMPRQQREVWEYPWKNVEDRRILWVQFSDDGIVREVIELHDYESDPPSGSDAGAMP
jgi:hypothetical protein